MKMNGSVEKMLKDVVKGAGSARPELQCVHFENGAVVVIDSHRLVRVNKLAPKDLKLDINLVDFSFPKVNYPKTDHLISEVFKTTFKLNKYEVIKILPALKAMYQDFMSNVQLSMDGTRLKISNMDKQSGNEQTISLVVEGFSGNEKKLSCNPLYLYEALSALAKFPDTRVRWIEMKVNSELTPFLLSIRNIDYLLTPVRVF
ncbi:hypothetical protein DA798_08595 [Lactobacillus sp. PFC-70]|nr:hypothetical protein DA798_08595 [Lactobacillus sp. PFC-70]